jgi:hypothetical protein
MLDQDPTMTTMLVVMVTLVGFIALGAGSTLVLIFDLFPYSVRATGFSVTHGVCVSLFGGFAQMIATWLVTRTHGLSALACYVAGCSLASLGGLYALPGPAKR